MAGDTDLHDVGDICRREERLGKDDLHMIAVQVVVGSSGGDDKRRRGRDSRFEGFDYHRQKANDSAASPEGGKTDRKNFQAQSTLGNKRGPSGAGWSTMSGWWQSVKIVSISESTKGRGIGATKILIRPCILRAAPIDFFDPDD